MDSFKSSVTTVAFHPSGRVVGVGSTDSSFELISCCIDSKYEDPDYKGEFSGITSFNENLIAFDVGGWVEGVAFSPSGNRLCFSVHKGVI